MHRNLRALALAALVAFVAAPAAMAAIANGGFETAGTPPPSWLAVVTFSTPSSVTSASPGVIGPGDPAVWLPQEGSRFARLDAGSVNVYTQLYQDFTVATAETLSFKVAWDCKDYQPFNDDGRAELVNLTSGAVLALYTRNCLQTGNYGGHGWNSVSQAVTAGNWRIRFMVRNLLDSALSSSLYADDVKSVGAGGTGDCAAIEAKLDDDSRWVSEAEFLQVTGALEGKLDVLEAKLDDHIADAQAMHDEMLRVHIENGLLLIDRISHWYLPAANGGRAEMVRQIVGDVIAQHLALGLTIGNAQSQYNDCLAKAAANEYKSSYDACRQAYRDAVTGS